MVSHRFDYRDRVGSVRNEATVGICLIVDAVWREIDWRSCCRERHVAEGRASVWRADTSMWRSEELLPTAQAKAAQVAANAPGSLRHTKRLLLATRSAEVAAARAREDAAFVLRVGSAENVEAIKAFFEKRKPDFSGLPQSGRIDIEIS